MARGPLLERRIFHWRRRPQHPNSLTLKVEPQTAPIPKVDRVRSVYLPPPGSIARSLLYREVKVR